MKHGTWPKGRTIERGLLLSGLLAALWRAKRSSSRGADVQGLADAPLGAGAEERKEEMLEPVMVTVADLAAQMGKDTHTLYEWAKRKDDPLPLRYARGERKNGSIDVMAFRDWWSRNSTHYQDRR